MWILVFAVLGAILLQHVLYIAVPSSIQYLKIFSTLFAGLLFLSVVLVGLANSRARKFLGSSRFAVPVLLFVAVYSTIGTLVVQGLGHESFMKMYGPPLAWVLEMLHFQEIFNSFAFCAVLGLGAGGLLLACAPIRPVTPARAGKLLAHLGILVILLGAAVGSIWGVRGRLGLVEGEQEDRFVASIRGATGHEEIALGFSLKLEDFQLALREPDFRLRLFDTGEGSMKLIKSVDPSKGRGEFDKLGGEGIRILNYWPDHEVVAEPLEAGEGEKGEAAALGLRKLEGDGKKLWLFSSEKFPEGGVVKEGTGQILFTWSEKRARQVAERLAASPGRKHRIQIGDHEIAVDVGEKYKLPGSDHLLSVIDFYHDFVIDMNTRTPANRSNEPDNPALKAAIVTSTGDTLESGWLFANFPDVHATSKDSVLARMRYTYGEGSDTPGPALLVVGEKREVWVIKDGTISSPEPLDLGGSAQLGSFGVAATDLLAEANIARRHITRSDKARDPAVEVRVEGRDKPVVLTAGRPERVSDDRMLVLSMQEENVEDYLSRLSVVEEGKTVLTQTIEVNHPLSYGGFDIYQSNYDPEKPNWTGLEVVRDPGILLVYLGFILNLAGVLQVIFGVPMIRRFRGKKGG
ncbi:MAG: cytochrome c biogenesis protein ResB [Pseudomonadota bacterium]